MLVYAVAMVTLGLIHLQQQGTVSSVRKEGETVGEFIFIFCRRIRTNKGVVVPPPSEPNFSPSRRQVPHSPTMQTVAHLYARMFARLSDGTHIAAVTVGSSLSCIKLHVLQVDPETVVYTTELAEEELSAMKLATHPGLTWRGFFELLQKAFGENLVEFQPSHHQVKIVLKHERQTDLIPMPAFTSSLLVTVPAPVGGPEAEALLDDVCAHMESYVGLRHVSGSNREELRLQDICRREEAAADECRFLAEEVDALTRYSSTLRAQSAFLGVVMASHSSDSERLEQRVADALEHDPLLEAYSTSRVGNPLTSLPQSSSASSSHSCLEYDVVLLQLVKSIALQSYHVMEGIGSSSFCDVIPPLRGTELGDENVKRLLGAASSSRQALFTMLRNCRTSWQFDVVEMQRLCEDAARASHPNVTPERSAGALFVLAYFLWFDTGAAIRLNISERRLMTFLSSLEAAYRQQSTAAFHSMLYAADVLQALMFLIRGLDAKKAQLGTIENAIALLAGSLIALGHQGLNNAFHVAAETPWAVDFCNTSVNESVPYTYFAEITKIPACDVFASLELATRQTLERSTAFALRMSDVAFTEQIMNAVSLRLSNDQTPMAADADDRDILLAVLLCGAKHAFCARNKATYTYFVKAMHKECLSQGSAEEAAKLPNSPFQGKRIRSPVDLAKLQLYVLNFVATPLFALIMDVSPEIASCGRFVAENLAVWEKAEERVALGQTLL